MSPEVSKDANEVVAKAPTTAIPGDGAATKQPTPAPSTAANAGQQHRPTRRVVLGVIAAVVLVVGIYCGVPVVQKILSTISTDDAYVNGHVTSVAARVPGQVTKVLVDDNYRVRKGSLLVQLDKEPYQIQVALKKATYENAKANVVAAVDQFRGLVASGAEQSIQAPACDRGRRQPGGPAAGQRRNARRPAGRLSCEPRPTTIARLELQKTPGAIAPQDVDQRREAYDVAQAQVTQALETVFQIRVGLGLPAKPQKDGDDAPRGCAVRSRSDLFDRSPGARHSAAKRGGPQCVSRVL